MKYPQFLFAVFVFISSAAFSQPVFLKSGVIHPQKNLLQKDIDSFNSTVQRVNGNAFALLQFQQIPSAPEIKKLLANGIVLLDYLPDNTYTVSINGKVSLPVLQSVKGLSLFQLEPRQKMQEHFAKGLIPAWAVTVPGTVDVWISFYKTLPAETILQQLHALNIDVLSTEHAAYNIISLRVAASRLFELAAQPFVEYIQPAPPKDQVLNNNSRNASRANILNATVANGGRGLNGEGVVVGVGDNADVQSHADFAGRLINRSPSPFSAHGTHTTATTAGAGNINELYRGFAPKATIISQAYSGIVDNAATYVQDYGMVITNNSYGNIIDCEYHGTYDLYARILDQQAFDLPNLLHVFSAGNSGSSICAPYPQGFRTVLGGYQSAKNVVTVGASTDSGLVAGFSSRGPVKDGRLKPEIIAQGQQVISAWPTNIYSVNNGTSMSAPAVSGGLALLYQRYKQLNGGANPKNGLMKAILCNGATDKGVAGPDFKYGLGWMNLLRSVEAIEGSKYFSADVVNAATVTHNIPVPANTSRLKILLYWNDVPASIISTKSLVNDIDLEVLDPTGGVVLPKILDTLMANLDAPAIGAADHVNNIEQVVINNPQAGNYTVRIKGTVITNAQQEYFVVYDAIPVQLKLTAPAGGEGLVPGETTKIIWEAHGFDAGTVNLEFSADGGATWVAIASNLDVNRQFFTWTVPAVATNNALVRITKTTGETSASTAFTIIGLPVVTLSAVQCEEYININWTAIPGATAYEVMRLIGDEMKTVATTTATNFTFRALSKDTLYFVTVRPLINGKAGRRAVAVSRQPNNGNCSGNISDNDLKVDAIITPTSGRRFTSTALTATTIISVRIKNLDDVAASNFIAGYSINNGTPVMETVNTVIAPGSTYVHTFSATADLSAIGNYVLRAFVKNSTADVNSDNDTITVIVKHIDNQPLNLASYFVDNVETAVPATYEKDTVGITGVERYDFARSTAFGRLRTFFNTGIAYSGSKAFTLDMNRLLAAGNVNNLYGTFHLGNYSTANNDLRLDFQYLHHNQPVNNNNRVWIRGSDQQPWIEAYKLDSAAADAGIYKKTRSIELTNLLAANGQAFTSSFQVRWSQFGQLAATDKENGAGYTIDDIRLYQVFNDVQMLRVDSPTVNSCGLAANARIVVAVRNSSNATLTNIPVSYRINNGTVVTEIIPSIVAGTTIQYSFSTPANLSAFGAYTILSYVSLNTDSFKENDTTSQLIYNTPVINTFPYLQNFESGDGNFYTNGKRSSWAYGTPANAKINGAASGARAWKTRLAGNYNDNELSYLYTPCFDVSGMTNPTISFSLALDLEDCGNTLCDGAWVEYSADAINWQKLGVAGAGTNWYNKTAARLWSVQNYTYWHVATQPLPLNLSRLRLRFVMASDPAVTREGVAIDDIHVYDNTKGIYDGPTVSAPITQNVSGNNWVDFTSGGKLVASIQPQNQTLGNTAVQAYIVNGPARNINNQYYHNRNITIKPASQVNDSVTVRFYFTDAETDSLVKATGCSICTKPRSAYELGVSKYTDPDKSIENGSVTDNQQGEWLFIPPAQVIKVPFDKGYYAEYKVLNFSEFWLNGGGIDKISSLPVKLMEFAAVKQGNDVLVSWKVGSETNVLRYEIELARGNDALQANSFTKIGEVISQGNTTATRQYSFVDREADKSGPRYYRLKIINADGSFRYSQVRAVVFGDVVAWQVFPNPGNGLFSISFQLNAGENVVMQVYDVKGSMVKEYRTVASGFLQKLPIDISANNYASGIYLIRVNAGSGIEKFFKVLKQ